MPTAPKTLRPKRVFRRQENRPNSHQRGYTTEWREASLAWLMKQFASGNVMCALCGRPLTGDRRSIHVDHIIDHKGDSTLMWDESNWQACHAACHSRKTAMSMWQG